MREFSSKIGLQKMARTLLPMYVCAFQTGNLLEFGQTAFTTVCLGIATDAIVSLPEIVFHESESLLGATHSRK